MPITGQQRNKAFQYLNAEGINYAVNEAYYLVEDCALFAGIDPNIFDQYNPDGTVDLTLSGTSRNMPDWNELVQLAEEWLIANG